jgi:hypothetical protein
MIVPRYGAGISLSKMSCSSSGRCFYGSTADHGSPLGQAKPGLEPGPFLRSNSTVESGSKGPRNPRPRALAHTDPRELKHRNLGTSRHSQHHPTPKDRHRLDLEHTSQYFFPAPRTIATPVHRRQRSPASWLQPTHAQPALVTGVVNHGCTGAQAARLLGASWRPCACFRTSAELRAWRTSTDERRCRSCRLGTKPVSVLEASISHVKTPWQLSIPFLFQHHETEARRRRGKFEPLQTC